MTVKKTGVRTSDHSFVLTFKVGMDLTGMSQVRLGIKRPAMSSEVKRDLPTADWNTLVAGGTLNVKIAKGDFTVPGTYLFQVYARKTSGPTEELSASSDEFELEVEATIIKKPWS